MNQSTEKLELMIIDHIHSRLSTCSASMVEEAVFLVNGSMAHAIAQKRDMPHQIIAEKILHPDESLQFYVRFP